MELIKGNSILDRFFDETTMSLHIKEGRPIIVKRGFPGSWKPIVLDEVLDKAGFQKLVDQIFKEVENRDDGFLEIDRNLSKVIQLGPYRIVIVHPPLSDGQEMTVVKPIKKLTLDDYKLNEETLDLLKNKAKGILVSGAPGSGKTTFAQALIDLYHQNHNIIKTVESPRDLLVSDDIVQYSFTYGSHDEVRDILLLSRPDYTVYDEVRNKSDFELFKDLRLTGIGLVGVIHATRPVDSIQRFLGTIEMGVIPQVIDTVIYIAGGAIQEIYQLELTVKVPEGMMSEELARPVIVVTSFLSKKAEYEIYTFGEQIVVMPLLDGDNKPKTSSSANKIGEYAKHMIQQKLDQVLPCDFLVKVKGNSINLYIPESFKGRIIGKGGTNINDLEKNLGLKIDIKSFDDLPILDAKVQISDSPKNGRFNIALPQEFANQSITLLIGEELLTNRTDPEGVISITKKEIIKLIIKKGFVIIDTNKL